MDLNLDEQRLIAEFRKLSATSQADVVSYVASLACRTVESGGQQNSQCSLKGVPKRPEADKSPIFTE